METAVPSIVLRAHLCQSSTICDIAFPDILLIYMKFFFLDHNCHAAIKSKGLSYQWIEATAFASNLLLRPNFLLHFFCTKVECNLVHIEVYHMMLSDEIYYIIRAAQSKKWSNKGLSETKNSHFSILFSVCTNFLHLTHF